MSYEACYFYFVFKNKLSNDQIITKLNSISGSSHPPIMNEQFNNIFSVILNHEESFGLSKKFLKSNNQFFTILFCSFKEDSFMEDILRQFLSEKIFLMGYSESDCYLSIFRVKYLFAYIFVSFVYLSKDHSLSSIISDFYQKISENGFSLITSRFTILRKKYSSLNTKLSSVKLSENDLKIALDYYNLTNLLSIKFSHFKISSLLPTYEPFFPILIKNNILSSYEELDLFFDLSMQKQIDLVQSWQLLFQSKITGNYSWEELLTIIFLLTTFIYIKREFFLDKSIDEKILSNFKNINESDFLEQKETIFKDF